MATKEEIMESIEKMTVLELSEMVKSLEEKFNVVAAAPVAAGGVSQQAATAPLQEEKTSFTVVLSNAGDKKIQVIKAVREVTNLGLKEAKDLVDTAPKPIKEGVNKEEAENIKKKFDGTGAVVEIK